MSAANRLRAAKAQLYSAIKGQHRFRYYRQLLAHEQLSATALAQLQWMNLQSLLEHAYRTVPYYHRIFKEHGMEPGDIRAPQDLEHLPVLTRTLVRTHGTELLSTSAAPGSYFRHSSGGSTGQPLDFYRDREYNEFANTAGGYRSFHRAGWNPGARMAWIWGRSLSPTAPAHNPLAKAKRRVGNWLRDIGITIFDAFDASPAQMAHWVVAFQRERPAFLHGYASALAHFAGYLQRNGIELSGVHGVISTAEPLYPDQRSLLRRAFGAVVIDMYGSREVPSIATGCRRGNMHINSDMVYLEFIDDPRDPTTQRILVTALQNKTFPFIRYEIGDFGRRETERCDCGLPFPRMAVTIGRVFDNFSSPEGRVVHGAFFKNLMDGVPGIEQFQFRQNALDTVVLLLKKSPTYGPATEQHLDWVRERFRVDFSRQARLTIEYVSSIQQTEQGKYRYTISQISPLTETHCP